MQETNHQLSSFNSCAALTLPAMSWKTVPSSGSTSYPTAALHRHKNKNTPVHIVVCASHSSPFSHDTTDSSTCTGTHRYCRRSISPPRQIPALPRISHSTALRYTLLPFFTFYLKAQNTLSLLSFARIRPSFRTAWRHLLLVLRVEREVGPGDHLPRRHHPLDRLLLRLLLHHLVVLVHL